jgi:two-component system LytT family sensor kinase
MRTKKIRFLYMLIVGILIALLIKFLVPFKNANHIFLYDILSSTLITIIIWEGSLRIDTYLNKRLPWVEKTMQRILYQFFITLIYSSVSIYFPMLSFNKFVCYLPPEKENMLIVLAIIIGVLVSFIILTIEISAHFFKNWKHSLTEVEKYKTESLQAQFINLKNQINPHFLFNNLSVLSSLVYKDQDRAVDFIQELSKVYRYVLDNQESELVALENELNFIESYVYLLKIRFDSSLKVNISLDSCNKELLVPPMSLQLLVENCIKHNEVSGENPLHIEISCAENYLQVRNNLQKRNNAEKSSNLGLKNIVNRYKHFTDQEVIISQSDSTFLVKIPLLKID